MADQQRPLPNAPFPAPPPFWKHFTTENIAKLKAIDDAPEDSEHSKPILPLELQYLRPPSPPVENYTIFGENQTVRLSPATIQRVTTNIYYPALRQPPLPRRPPTFPRTITLWRPCLLSHQNHKINPPQLPRTDHHPLCRPFGCDAETGRYQEAFSERAPFNQYVPAASGAGNADHDDGGAVGGGEEGDGRV